MAITRQSILRGPAIIQMGGQSIYTAGDIKVSIAPDTFRIPTAMYGDVGERLDDVKISLSFTPSGMWTNQLLAVLYPRSAALVGQSIFGETDTPAVIYPQNGKEKVTLSCAAITKMPGLKLSSTVTAMKEVTITALIKNNADRAAADSLYTLADAAFSDGSFSLASVYTVPYTAALSGASAPWDNFQTEDGFEVDFDETLEDVTVANTGTVDMTHGGLDVSVKFKPLGMTVAQVLDRLKIQGTGVARGMDMGAGAANLTISGGSGKPQVVVNNVRLKSAPQIYGRTALRHDTLEFVATRPTGGASFTIGIGG